VTPAYVVVVAAGRAAMCLATGAASRAAIVRANSTDVANLLHGRLYTLLSSALVLEGRACLLALPVLAVALAIAELTWGGLVLAAVFLYGHIVATLLVFAGLVTGLVLHQLSRHVVNAPDVGPSYGAVAVLGALLASGRLGRAVRWQLAAVLLATSVLLVGRTFTDAGHLVSLLLGIAAGHFWRTRSARLSAAPAGGS
jgi:hypothetical protein